jgi:nucleotide-binding universal stress UspA family protein
MKSILIPVEESELLDSVLETALLVARRFGSHMEGLHVRPDFAGIIAATGMGAPYVVEDFRKEDWDSIQRSRTEFERFLNRNDVPLDGGAGTGQPWATFRVEAPPGDDFIGQHARLFDVTVLGQPSRGATPPRMSTLEAALFDGGRPVLVAPPMAPKRLGDTVMIAWNASTETARTVAFARTFLEQAERVFILSVEGGMVAGPSAEEAARYLTRSGIPAQAMHVPQNRGVGETILEHVKTLEVDLLIKGAYTQSRLRQMIFGGATSHILSMANVPVLLAH